VCDRRRREEGRERGDWVERWGDGGCYLVMEEEVATLFALLGEYICSMVYMSMYAMSQYAYDDCIVGSWYVCGLVND
jgi:hypothetical protein